MKDKPKNRHWFLSMSEFDRLCFYSNMLMVPGLIILIYYQITGIELSIPKVYIIMDAIIVWLIRRSELRWIAQKEKEEEEERSGRADMKVMMALERLKEAEAQWEKEEQERKNKTAGR